MTRKLFYFVRHGESLFNAARIRQGADGSLSENGKAQAISTGKRLANHPIEIILASPYTRTCETADIINHQLTSQKTIEYSELLKERRNPSEIIGKSMNDPEISRIIDTIDKSYHTDDYRFSDEENFQDLKLRAHQLLDHLAVRPESCLLVVTHGIFLRMVVACIEYGERLNSATYNTLSLVNVSNNASITICEYKKGWFGPPIEERWKVIAWDDYSRVNNPTSRPI